MIYIILLIIVTILCALYIMAKRINEMILFQPTKVNYTELNTIIQNNDKNIISEQIQSGGQTIWGLLYNKHKTPSWDDNIILYSHGNAGWMGYLIGNNTLDLLSKYGSVFVYDYRGYGVTNGTPSEESVYEDIAVVWDYLIKEKNINQNKIIIYGHSLGCAISSYLVSKLCLDGNILPKAIILEAPFICLKKIAENFIPKVLTNLVVCHFDNNRNLNIICNSIPIYIIHSPNDEIIPYDHGKSLAKIENCKLIEISGTHNFPIYNSNVDNTIKNILE